MAGERKVGRPPWIPTAENIADVEKLASRGLTHEQIADCLGIGLSTLYDKKYEFEEFGEAIKRGKGKGIGTMANALFENGEKGNVTAQIFWLKNQAKWNDGEVKPEDLGRALGTAVKEALSKNEQPR